ncbi:unnamed protein product [Rotaria magnacalcarata]|uniref:HAT C-terminal dimerisation domain-containing protein n=1 Tax=Rotaria magnacalcarata TaxID=392030 RepID=A0A816XKA7_9BILA|nr:unnamed protein product [Rotaria magnacalcarata]CAF4239110.1 unnamed protein product [Rotaria magnacalcarata]
MTGKDGKLNKHFKSTAHISAYQRLQMFNKENLHIDIQLDKQRVYVNHRQQELLKLNRYVISTLLDVTKVLARQSLSFRAEIESDGNFNDGELNMCGEYKGVKAMLSESVGREVIFVPCCAHCSNKIVEHASQNSLEAAKFFGLCEKLYVFLTGSTKRVVIYPTRVGLRNIQYSSVVAIHESFNEIVDTLDELCNDNDKTTKLEANSIREKIVSYEYYCLLLFVKHLMSMTNALTTTLQDEDLDVLSAIDSLTKTICLLNKLRDDEDTTNKLLELAKERIAKYDVDADDEFSKTHRRRVRSLQVYYRKIFYQMMDQLKSEYIDLLKALEEKLKPFSCLWPSKIPDFRKEDAEQIKIIVPGIDSSDLLYYDVQLLIDDLQNCSSIRDVMVLFSQHNYQKSDSRLYRVYVFIYTLPVTVASNERAFSRLKLIKNYLRSKMFDERLMDLILCSSEKDLADSLNLDELVTTWNTKPRLLLV